MACAPGTETIIRNPTNEAALQYFPARGRNGDHLRLHAANTASVDATIAVAIRCCAEHFAGVVRIPVGIIEPPADPAVHSELDALLGTNLPAGFTMATPASSTTGPPSTVILPATRIDSYDRADELAGLIVRPLGMHYGRTAMSYLAGSFAVLVENGLDHASDSTVGVVAALSYDRQVDQLRLVVADSGTGLSLTVDSGDAIVGILDDSESNSGGLGDLRGRAHRDGLGVQVMVASGPARAVTTDGDEWKPGSGEQLDGFVTIVNVAAH